MDSDQTTRTDRSPTRAAQRKIKLVIAYDGTDYHGWQIQPGRRTVQGMLCAAATAVLRRPTHVQGASRTDAGVHAQGQVGVLKTMGPISVDHLPLALNDHLPRDIVVLHAQEVEPDFDVTADVAGKAYRYTICTGRFRPVRHIRFCWHFPASLDVEAMQAAAQYLVGTRDFRSFAVALEASEDTVRTVFRCDATRNCGSDLDRITIDVEGSGFLRHMVRIMAGTLIDIGRGHWRPEEMADILAARSRAAAGHLAPASGLCLEWIKFRQDDPADARGTGMAQVAPDVSASVERFLAVVRERLRVDAAYLYGSQVGGAARPWSDIDVAVVSPDFSDDLFQERVVLMQWAAQIDDRIKPQPFTPERFGPNDLLAHEIAHHGVRLI